MGGVVALEVVFEEGEMGEMAADDDDDWSVFEVVVVVVSVLPSPYLLLASLLVVLLDCIGTNRGVDRVLIPFFQLLFFCNRIKLNLRAS